MILDLYPETEQYKTLRAKLKTEEEVSLHTTMDVFSHIHYSGIHKTHTKGRTAWCQEESPVLAAIMLRQSGC